MHIIRRYVLREIVTPFALGLFVITILFLIQKIILITEWAVNRGVGARDMALMVAYVLPLVLLIVIPVTSLFSILLAMSRLSTDHEVIALKASGISVFRLVPPALLFSLWTMMLGLYTSLELMPQASRASRALRYRIVKTKSEQGLPVRTFLEFVPGTMIYIRDKDESGLKGVILAREEYVSENIHGVKRKTLTRRYVAFADLVQVHNDPATLTNTLILYHGQAHLHDLEHNVYHAGRFGRAKARIVWEDEALSPRDERLELSGIELWARIQALKETLAAEQSLAGEEAGREKELRELLILFYERLVFPLGCLALCFWGVPLGIAPPRAGMARSVILAAGLSLIFYYLIVIGKALALQGYVPPGPGLFAPLFLVVLSGLYFLRQRGLERPVFILSWLESELYYRLDQMRAWWKRRQGEKD